ncbi:endoplasmic reticulum-Golgi intermediate compartment protein [Skeletonema marinoi]|uniref:Endoplasmic reticulum-Golgi intermediate compartment protein n=1 Tax=Skeletonema marinoi TaxID=267567 RepID=A0AAD8XRL7_9STRA|nr:endoplasmic reticulum-Golgi intermediate compartment protein [Skeletonema marinoi]
MMYQQAAPDITQTSLRGRILSGFAMATMATLFTLETKAYFSKDISTTLSLVNSNSEQRIRLNFNITMMDLPCDYATVDVYSTVGFQKNITKDVRKFNIDEDGVLQQYEARNWHQDDVELWDPAVIESVEDLHGDGEDAISLDGDTFPYAKEEYPFLFVKFYTSNCPNCDDFAPTWEALGEIVTDTSMHMVDEFMEEKGMDYYHYSDEEYEQAVNVMAPVLVTRLDCGAYPDVCKEEQIRAYPTTRLFVDGKAAGDYDGHRTVMELVHWLSHMEAAYRQPGQFKMHNIFKHASERTIRSEEERIWNDALMRYRAPSPFFNSTRHPGCQLVGHVMVDTAPGKFLIQAQSFEAQERVENGGWKGIPSKFVQSLHPLDGNVYVTSGLHQAYHHHMRVVTTEFEHSHLIKWAGETANIDIAQSVGRRKTGADSVQPFLVAISNFGALESLDLSGCTKLALTGASHIGKKCRHLKSLSLASCGDCVSNALFEAMILRLAFLKTVNLSFCKKISDRSLKALSKCQHLQTLDLTGCTAVTDTAILLLCEGTYISPGLRNLFLAGCTKVTDTSLSWIADGLKTIDGFLSLETLSLKGTHVTLPAMKGIQDGFPYSSLRSNASYFGAWPLSRIENRKIIKHYHKRACAAAKIQALVRSRQEKDTLQHAREEYAKKRVAIRIGALHRGRKARVLFKKLKKARKQHQVSCRKLQCAFRCFAAKKARARLYKQKFDRLKPQACRCLWRGYAAKQQLSELKVAFVKQRQLELAASSRIYAIFRHFGFRKAVKVRIAKSKERVRCALVIQLWFRQVKEDIRRRIIAEREELELRIRSASVIQRNARKRAAYLLLVAAKRARDEMLAHRDEKAHILCHFGRLCIAKNRMQTAREEFEEEVKRVYLLSMWASTKISAAWRGKVGRDMAKAARIVRAQRWKTMWSEKDEMTFYYNLDTGETRWEKPQVLLDIEPKPVCCNCFNFQAEMECRECEEFYCTNCFDIIHLGGKRSTHSYKTVYDYYGQRKDINLEPWIPLQDTSVTD